MYGLTRGTITLLGAAGAGLLVWLATQVDRGSNGGYWAQYGLVAAAGLVMAFSQILGGWTKWGVPRVSPYVFVLGFVPVLVVGGWILLAHQPHTGFFRGTINGWSNDLGIDGVVGDFADMLPALSFLIGLTLGFTFDTSGPRMRAVAPATGATTPAAAPVDRRAADAPLTAERNVAARDGAGEVVATRSATRAKREGAPRTP